MGPLSEAEKFKIDLEALLAKYPTVRMDVTHTIQVVELTPKVALPEEVKAPEPIKEEAEHVDGNAKA